MSLIYALMGSAPFCSPSSDCSDEGLNQSGFSPAPNDSSDSASQCDCLSGFCYAGPTSIRTTMQCHGCTSGLKQWCKKSTSIPYQDIQLICGNSCPAGWDDVGTLQQNSESNEYSCTANNQEGGGILLYNPGTERWVSAACPTECTQSTKICARPLATPQPLNPLPQPLRPAPMPLRPPIHPLNPIPPVPLNFPLNPLPKPLNPIPAPIPYGPPKPSPLSPFNSLTPLPSSLTPIISPLRPIPVVPFPMVLSTFSWKWIIIAAICVFLLFGIYKYRSSLQRNP